MEKTHDQEKSSGEIQPREEKIEKTHNQEKSIGEIQPPVEEMEKTHDQEQSSCEIDKLPDEIIFNILSILPITSVLQCRCVCKSWLKIVRDPQFAYAQLAQSTGTDSNTILWCRTFCSSNKMYLAEYDTFKISNEITWIPEVCGRCMLPRCGVVGSCNGLICLSYPSEFVPVYVCNPLTREYMALPQSFHRAYLRAALGFGFASNTKEYKVVRTIPVEKDNLAGVSRSHVEVYTLGTGYWRSKGTIPYRLNFNFHWNMFLNGALHWTSDIHNPMLGKFIVSFDMGDEEFRLIPLPELILINDGTHSRHVGVIGGCLSIHNYSRQGCIDIWMMKDYGVKESWSKYFVFSEGRYFFPLDTPRNGKPILGRYRSKLVTYDVGSQKFTYLQLQGFPDFDRVYPHVASFLTLESACGGEKMSRTERRNIKGKIMRVMDTSSDLKKNKRAHVFWTKEIMEEFGHWCWKTLGC